MAFLPSFFARTGSSTARGKGTSLPADNTPRESAFRGHIFGENAIDLLYMKKSAFAQHLLAHLQSRTPTLPILSTAPHPPGRCLRAATACACHGKLVCSGKNAPRTPASLTYIIQQRPTANGQQALLLFCRIDHSKLTPLEAWCCFQGPRMRVSIIYFSEMNL